MARPVNHPFHQMAHLAAQLPVGIVAAACAILKHKQPLRTALAQHLQHLPCEVGAVKGYQQHRSCHRSLVILLHILFQ